MTLQRVISGGQTGADQAGLRAAKACGISTGGWAPRGWKTSDGPRYDLGLLFNMVESNLDYAGRTELNVLTADATLRLAVNFGSRGELCTLRNIRKLRRPYMDVDLNSPQHPAIVAQWIVDGKFQVLNIAGNSESKSENIGYLVEKYLLEVFRLVRNEE